MALQKNLDLAYMKCAFAVAELSRAERKKVGAILVSPAGGIIAEGFNGTPRGFDNCCEILEIVCKHEWVQDIATQNNICYLCQEERTQLQFSSLPTVKTRIVTKLECLHAESNAIAKIARSNNSSDKATLYCTLSPCFECSKLIIQAGITRVVYAEDYPYASHSGPVRLVGLELLKKANILVDKLDCFI